MFVLSFILPKIYEMRKHDIDSAVSQGYNSSQRGYNQYLKPYVEKIPRASTSARSSGTTSGTTGPTAAGESQAADQDTQAYRVPCVGGHEAIPHARNLHDAAQTCSFSQSCIEPTWQAAPQHIPQLLHHPPPACSLTTVPTLQAATLA